MALKISKNSISLAGEFAVLSQLALRGLDATMTLGNTKSVDILISNPETQKLYRLEVKTNYVKKTKESSTSKTFGRYFSDWIMSEKHEHIAGPSLYYCFVNIFADTGKFRFFVVPSNTVARYIREQHMLWRKSNPKSKESDLRSFRIGFNEETYKIKTPTLEKFENNWNFDMSPSVIMRKSM